MQSQAFFKPNVIKRCYCLNDQLVTINQLKSSDITELAKVARQTNQETFTHGYYTDAILDKRFGDEFVKEILPAALLDKNNIYLALKVNKVLVGYARVMFDEFGSMLDKLYLLKAHQGKGYGKLLIQFCIDLAIEAGHNAMDLIVFEQNPKAIRFYESYGFKATNERYIFKNPTTGEETDLIDIKMHCDNLRTAQNRPQTSQKI